MGLIFKISLYILAVFNIVFSQQNYVQALQRKVMDGCGETSTLQSDATHLTILPDSTAPHLACLADDEIQHDLHYG